MLVVEKWWTKQGGWKKKHLPQQTDRQTDSQIVEGARDLGRRLVTKLDADVDVVLLGLDGVLVDLGGLGDLLARLELARLVRGVLLDDVALGVLEVAQTHKDDVALCNPHLLAQTPGDVALPLRPVKALDVHAPVPEHLGHLRVLLALLLQHQLALRARSVTLSLSPVLASLALVLRHCCQKKTQTKKQSINQKKERRKKKGGN